MSDIREPSAMLIAEIGSVTTRVTLVDAVEGETRLIGQAEVPSTIESPEANATVALLEATARIGEATGRQLLRDGELLIPQSSERDGVDAVVAITSAAGLMGVVIAAVSADVSARSALRASRATYTTILQVVTLDDSARSIESGEASWIEQQVQALTGLAPDVVLIAGGLEDGARDALIRLAHIVGLMALSARVDTEGRQRPEIAARPVIFAGNSHARDHVIEALSGRAELNVVDNLRPTLEVERLEPARRALAQLYSNRILPALPGSAALRRLCRTPIHAACEATGLMARFVAERYGRSVLALDAGSMNTTACLAGQGRYSPAVLGGVGTGYGVGAVLAERGLAAIARWLPFAIEERALAHWLLNKMLRPQLLPVTREDVLIEHAVACEALELALASLWDERPASTYDLVIGAGGVLAHAPHPGLAALTILNALQPTADETVLALDLHLDTLGLLGCCGALAFAEADAALTVFERDLLRNTPLATCVVALGDGRTGEPAVEAELRIVGGDTRRVEVAHGQIGRLPLAPGRSGQLVVRPAGGVRIGRNAPGAEVASEVAAISGSALGVIIDARGRPLRLPDEPLERQQALWSWLVALGAERGPFPYAAADGAPEALASISDGQPGSPITIVEIPSSAPAAPPLPPDSAPPALERDLAQLRQTVEEPKKRGFFRR